MKVWIIETDTESGDHDIIAVLDHEPTQKEIDKITKDAHPCESYGDPSEYDTVHPKVVGPLTVISTSNL